jgi:hypothetical protein
MAVTLNQRAYAHAQRLLDEGRAVRDDRDAGSEHRPSARQENDFLAEHGWSEYEKWFLGIDDEHREETKQRYKFPYGTSGTSTAARCCPRSPEPVSTRTSVELACAHLHGSLDAQP